MSTGYGDPYADAADERRKMERLRDEFAMAALTGLLAYPGTEILGNWNNNAVPADVAHQAYAHADAMMERRKR